MIGLGLGLALVLTSSCGEGDSALVDEGDAVVFPSDISNSILFFSDRSGNGDLWLVDPSDGVISQVTLHGGNDYEPDWTSDHATIVFSSNRTNSTADLFLLTVDDGVEVPLTNTPDSVDDYSNLSPDGSTVVFQRTFTNQSPATAEIVVIDIATGVERRITDNADWDSTPSFSPDGETIIFESDRTGTYELWTVSLDGSNATQLTESPVGTVNSEARFSQDGAWIIFTTRAPGGNGDLFLLEAGGGQPIRFTEGSGSDGHGEFSPDGESIVFHRDGDIYLVDADGKNLRQLTSGLSRDLDPHWH